MPVGEFTAEVEVASEVAAPGLATAARGISTSSSEKNTFLFTFVTFFSGIGSNSLRLAGTVLEQTWFFLRGHIEVLGDLVGNLVGLSERQMRISKSGGNIVGDANPQSGFAIVCGRDDRDLAGGQNWSEGTAWSLQHYCKNPTVQSLVRSKIRKHT